MKKIIIILILCVSALSFNIALANIFDDDPIPVITDIYPESIRTETDGIITVSGYNFGDRKATINLVSKPTQGVVGIDSSDIISWTNEEIKFRLSRPFGGGPDPNDYFVNIDPWADFSLKDTTSTKILKIYIGQPEIWSSYPDKADVGSKITILGNNFGWKEKAYNYNSSYNDLKLYVGSTQVKDSDIISWWQSLWDSKIEFRVGNYLTSGLVSIKGTSIMPHVETSGDYLNINSNRDTSTYLDYPSTSTPTNLKVVKRTTKGITISWDEVVSSGNLKPAKIFYNIFGSKYDCSFSAVHALTPYNGFIGNADEPPYTIENLSSNTTYCFKIKAVFLYDPTKGSSSIESDFTSTISTTTLAVSEPVVKCQDNSTFIESKCICNKGYVAYGDKCVIHAEFCQITRGENSYPVDNSSSLYPDSFYCQCKEGYELSAGKCVTKKEPSTSTPVEPKPEATSKPKEEQYQKEPEDKIKEPQEQTFEAKQEESQQAVVKKIQVERSEPKAIFKKFLANALTAIGDFFKNFFKFLIKRN